MMQFNESDKISTLPFAAQFQRVSETRFIHRVDFPPIGDYEPWFSRRMVVDLQTPHLVARGEEVKEKLQLKDRKSCCFAMNLDNMSLGRATCNDVPSILVNRDKPSDPLMLFHYKGMCWPLQKGILLNSDIPTCARDITFCIGHARNLFALPISTKTLEETAGWMPNACYLFDSWQSENGCTKSMPYSLYKDQSGIKLHQAVLSSSLPASDDYNNKNALGRYNRDVSHRGDQNTETNQQRLLGGSLKKIKYKPKEKKKKNKMDSKKLKQKQDSGAPRSSVYDEEWGGELNVETEDDVSHDESDYYYPFPRIQRQQSCLKRLWNLIVYLFLILVGCVVTLAIFVYNFFCWMVDHCTWQTIVEGTRASSEDSQLPRRLQKKHLSHARDTEGLLGSYKVEAEEDDQKYVKQFSKKTGIFGRRNSSQRNPYESITSSAQNNDYDYHSDSDTSIGVELLPEEQLNDSVLVDKLDISTSQMKKQKTVFNKLNEIVPIDPYIP